MRRSARVDTNQAEIVAAFRRLGCSVLSLASLGRGAPDLAVGYGGLTMLVEVKDGARAPSERQLTPAQRAFRDDWKGGVRLVQDFEDVALTVATLRRWQGRLCNSSS